jgi:hypothetical protein
VAPLYQLGTSSGPAVRAVAQEIRAAGGSPAEQALHALQFVQEQIRYVSISIGEGAFRPAQPGRVLERRFGDCKDKSLLLVAILRELGIEAQLALVNSTLGRRLDSILPTPYAFDHAIVRITLGNAVYWLDATREKQFTPVTENVVGDLERALVLDSTTHGLAIIPRLAPDAGSKRSEVLIDLRGGIDKPAKLQVTTFYAGTWADTERHALAEDTAVERQTSYLNYIVRYYPSARIAAPISVHDDLAKNVVEVGESYDIEQPFTKTDDGRPKVFLQADEVYRYLDPAKVSVVRKAPLAVGYPVRVQQTVRALLPWPLNIENETVTIENPAFRYQDAVNYSKEGGVPQLTVAYRYEALADSVDIAALPRYVEDRRRAYDDAGYYILPGTGPARKTVTFAKAEPRWPLAAAPRWVALMSLILALYVASRFMLRWDPQPAEAESNWPVGIRGWLLLPAVVVILSLLGALVGLYNGARYLQVDRWARLHTVVPDSLKAWAPAVMLVLVACGVCYVVARVLLVYLFFARRSSAPRALIVIEWAGLVYFSALVLFPIAAHLSAPVDSARLASELTAGVIRAGIYTAYLLSSKRVKATFVVRLSEPRTAMPAAIAQA